MRHHGAEETGYMRKTAFSRLLSKELSGCRYNINVRYEWMHPGRIFAFRFSGEHAMVLSINLNMGKEGFFRASERSAELDVRYRSYFIVNYIRLLENAAFIRPQSYFAGLVLLCAANDACSTKRTVSVSPAAEKRQNGLRPIDVQCAIQALSRLLSDCDEMLSADTRHTCDVMINNLLTYSLLPEIEYRKSLPVYSLLSEMKQFCRNVSPERSAAHGWALFPEKFIDFFEKMTLDDFAAACGKSGDPFWTGAAVRLLGYAMGDFSKTEFAKKNFAKGDAEKEGIFDDCVRCFEEDSARYARKVKETSCRLLIDNYTAIKRIAGQLENGYRSVSPGAGGLHCYR